MTTKILSLITATLLLTTYTFADTTLEDITVVSTNKVPTSIQNTTANITVITASDIKEHGYQTVAQAISTVSGISVSHAGGLGQQTSFFVRGADSGKVLVLLDGMRLNDPSTTNGTAQLEFLTTDNIEQIEIIKGGAGNIWGSNASAGVINIITKNAKSGVHGTLGLSYGSYVTKGTDLSLSYKDEKFTAQIISSYLDTKGFSAKAPRPSESDSYTNKNINMKIGYTWDVNNQLKLSYNHVNNDLGYDVTNANDDFSKINAKQTNIALEYLFKHNNYSAQFFASQGKYDREATNPFGGISTYATKIKELSLINTFEYTRNKAIIGFEHKNITGDNQYHSLFFNSINKVDYTNKAIYLSNAYKISEDTLFETNLRYDNYSKFDNKTTYKIGLKHDNTFIKDFTTSVNYYTSSDVPSAYQYANPVLGVTLKPSYTKGYDIGASYKQLLTITYFNNTVKDTIDYDNGASGYYNVNGTSKFSGLEIESDYTFPTLDLIANANYTHLFDYKKEDGSDLIRRAKDTLNASLAYYINEMHFGVDALYVGERFDTDGGFPVASNVPTGNYTLWNLNFSTKIMQNFDLSINAKNIFNKDYQSVYGYATEGRSVYAKVSYSF